MSDMVQQPVIQLVQELTMTAVVERHDCTDTKKKKERNQESKAKFEYQQSTPPPSGWKYLTWLIPLDRSQEKLQGCIGTYSK